MIQSGFPSAGPVRLNAEGGFGILKREGVKRTRARGQWSETRHFPVVLSIP